MGKGKRKHKNKAKNGGDNVSNGSSRTNGVGVGGSDGRSTSDRNNDILLSLEESVDWHNQTTGFVSSYTLPLSADNNDNTVNGNTNNGSPINAVSGGGSGNGIMTNGIDIASQYSSLVQPIALTRIESLESTTSSKTDNDQHETNNLRDIFRPPSRSPSHSPKAKGTVDVCTPPPTSTHYRRKSSGDFSAGNNKKVCSPTERSIASDSTDAASNLARIRFPSPVPGSTTPTTPGIGGGLKFNPSPAIILTDASAATDKAKAAAKNSIAGKHNQNNIVVGHVIDAKNARDMAGISPLKDSGMDSPRMYQTNNNTISSSSNNANANGEKTKTRRKSPKNNHHNHNYHVKPKKNNLVIQHTPSNNHNLSRTRSYSQHRSHKSTSFLPPPHPLSNVQSYPPMMGTSPNRGLRKHHDHSNSIQSMYSMSDASSCASEATPIISPARKWSQTFSFSSEEGDLVISPSQEDKQAVVVVAADENDDDEFHGEKLVDVEVIGGSFEEIPIQSSFKEGEAVPRQISTADLKGIDISFTESDAEDENENENPRGASSDAVSSSISPLADDFLAAPPQASPNNSKSIASTNTTPALSHSDLLDQPQSNNVVIEQQQQYSNGDAAFRGDAFFGAHTRQFSSDTHFFEGIHNSGLQSMSFEQVADADLNTSRETEIELVYNTGSFDAGDGANSVLSALSGGVVTNFVEDEKIENEEQKKEVVERILQWRRGRNRSIMNREIAAASSVEEDDQQEEEEDEDDEEYDDYDDVELAPLTSSSANSNSGVGNEHTDGQKHSQSYPGNSIGWRWRSPTLFIRNFIWRWHLPPMPPNRQHDNMATPKKNNMTPIRPTFDNYGDEDDDDGDESKGLTTPTITPHSRMQSKHYDDVDFDRNASGCWCCLRRSYFLCCGGKQPTTWQIHSGWKKLFAISILFLSLAWILSNGKLEKHHNHNGSSMFEFSYPSYMYGDILTTNDPLARENFVEEIERITDEDDNYYAFRPMESPIDDDDQFHSSSFLNNNGLNQYENDVQEYQAKFAAAGSASIANTDSPEHKTEHYNNLVGIDTIIVLGSGHAGADWLVEKLDRLYPDMSVQKGFSAEHYVPRRDPRSRDLMQKRDVINSSASRHLRVSRALKIIDPTSNKEVVGENAISSDQTKHRKSKSAHILVIAAFLNPYDWVELMRVDPHSAMEWDEFVQAELPSFNKTILEFRADYIRSTLETSADQDDVKLVLPIRYEELVEPYSNYDNYLGSGISDASTLPGIVGLLDQIQARTGLHPDEMAGWKETSKSINQFWADNIGCSGHICFNSINKLREYPKYVQYMNEHVDWEAEQLIGYQKRSVPKPSIDRIVVLGERHSGAEWLVDRLGMCFPGTFIQYGLSPSRPGEWFQDTATTQQQGSTLVISVFLNPYDWTELMRQHPINAPAHMDMEWSEFVTSAWTRKRSNLDNKLVDTTNAKCSFGFSFDEVVPCMTNRDPKSDYSFPVYELHHATSSSSREVAAAAVGTPYSNILELRADKIRNFFNTEKLDGVVDFISVRYEDLVWDDNYGHTGDNDSDDLPFPGIVGLLEKIRDQTSLIPDINAGWINDDEGVFKAEPLGVDGIVTKLDPYYVQWMEDHVDWDAERLVGYSPWH